MSQTRDPLSELIYSKNDYIRRILSEEEQVLTRMECSFYGNSLKVIEEYTKFISSILPNWNKVARRVNIHDYFKTLFAGEKKYGRTIFLREQ